MKKWLAAIAASIAVAWRFRIARDNGLAFQLGLWLGTIIVAAAIMYSTWPARAQWQVPDHAVPLGNGAGVTGFSSAAPGISGTCLASNGASSDPTFQACGSPAVASMTALRALTPGQYNSVVLTGYTSAGDGGEGLFYWDGASSATDDVGTIVQPNAGGTGRWKRVVGSFGNVVWFGAVCDGSTNDATAINAAIGWAKSQNGIKVVLPPRICAVGSTITLDGSRLWLEGTTGMEAINDVGGAQTSSALLWTGGGSPVISVTSVAGGGNRQVRGAKVKNLGIYCAGVASTEGLRVNSVAFSEFTDLTMVSCASALNVTASITPLAEDAGSCRNTFRNITAKNTSGTGNQVILTGTGTYNTCFNTFSRMYVQHGSSGHGIFVGDADNNLFLSVETFRASGGSGWGIILSDNGSPSGSAGTARQNAFYGVSTVCGGGCSTSLISASATSHMNTINNLDTHSNPSLPTVTAGGELIFKDNSMTIAARNNVPTLSSCGTSPVLSTSSNDGIGRLATGSGATGCVITWSRAYGTLAPICVVTPDSTGNTPTVATTTTTMTLSAIGASQVFNYHCAPRPFGYLLNRDLIPGANDNAPAWINRAA